MKKFLKKLEFVFEYYFLYFMYSEWNRNKYHDYMNSKWGDEKYPKRPEGTL